MYQNFPNSPKTKYFHLILSFLYIFTACNFDFENGIDGWETSGTVFNNQPTFGDNPTERDRMQPSKRQGNWWIGGFENRPSEEAQAGVAQGDELKGKLTSPRFRIIGKDISFLIDGGCDVNVIRVELLVNNEVKSDFVVSRLSRRSFTSRDTTDLQ